MKEHYVTIKRFYQVYKVETAVLAVMALYISMLLAAFFYYFQFKNADLESITACKTWDSKVSIQAVILFCSMAIVFFLGFAMCFLSIKRKHIQEDEILAHRKKRETFFQTYISELVIAYMSSQAQGMLFFYYLRYQFLKAASGITDLIAYKQLVFDSHTREFLGGNIIVFLLIFPNFAYVVKVRRNENIIKLFSKMRKASERRQD